MKNRRPRSIFEILFSDEFLSDSFFSMSRMNFSNEVDNDGFPKDGDPNFNKTEEVIDSGTHSIKKETWTSVDGTQTFSRTSMMSKQTSKSLKEPTKEELKLLMDKAVEEQEFEKAIEYRDKLNKLKE